MIESSPPHGKRRALGHLRAGQPEGLAHKTPAVKSHQQKQGDAQYRHQQGGPESMQTC